MAETRYAARFRKVVAALRARGFDVVVEDGAYSRTVPGKDLLTVTSDVVHHTAGGNDASDRRVVRDGRTGLRGPLSQFLTHRDGTLRLLATGYANHAGSTLNPSVVGNSRSVGNEIVSAGLRESDFTAAQLRAARALSEELAAEFGYPHRWTRGHKEEGVPLGRKVDPAFSMPAHRAALGAGTTTPAPAPAPRPTTPEDDMAQVPQAEWNRIRDRIDHLFEETDRTARQGAIDSADVKATLSPGGLIHDVLRNTEGVAARGKNLTIELLQRPSVSPAQVAEVLRAVGGVPAATVDEAVRRLAALAPAAHDDETPAAPLPTRTATPATGTAVGR